MKFIKSYNNNIKSLLITEGHLPTHNEVAVMCPLHVEATNISSKKRNL